MKKFLSIVLITVIATLFVGCSSNDSSNLPIEEKVTGTINVITREEGSGTREAFIELTNILEKGDNGTRTDNTYIGAIVLSKTQAVMSNVSGDKRAIGYISLGSVNDTIKAVKVEGAEVSAEAIKDGSYKLQRPFNIVTKQEVTNKVAKDFIDFIFSSDGQRIVEDNGYVTVSEAGAYSGNKPSGEILIVGSSSVSPVMEKLKEAYEKINSNAKIKIETNDSSTGIKSAINGTCDIAMASRELKETELGVKSQKIALDGIAIIINNQNQTDNLTIEQIKKIFTGEITEWEKI